MSLYTKIIPDCVSHTLPIFNAVGSVELNHAFPRCPHWLQMWRVNKRFYWRAAPIKQNTVSVLLIQVDHQNNNLTTLELGHTFNVDQRWTSYKHVFKSPRPRELFILENTIGV